MYYVYLLRSEHFPKQQYVGLTHDLRRRVRDHNEGRSPNTAKFCPWILVAYFALPHEKTAIAFEKYLRSGSGRAFINATSFNSRKTITPIGFSALNAAERRLPLQKNAWRKAGDCGMSWLSSAEKSAERSEETVREGRRSLGETLQLLREWPLLATVHLACNSRHLVGG